jgi:hypothetical protein
VSAATAPVLAFVFWHAPAAGVLPDDYEDAVGAFHAALAEDPPAGFRRSLTFRIGDAPWQAGGGYEDWYLVDGSHALDPLDEAAVSSAAGARHDVVAALAGQGAGGLYRLRAGREAIADADTAIWLGKPAKVSYDELYQRLSPWCQEPGVGLWRRQMVLGPAPEFCLRGPGSLELPGDLAPLPIGTARVWP